MFSANSLLRTTRAIIASQMILEETTCSESSASDTEDNETDTDLSGVVVEDDAELSVHGSESVRVGRKSPANHR